MIKEAFEKATKEPVLMIDTDNGASSVHKKIVNEKPKLVSVNIGALVSGLKIEVHQCDCCTDSDVSSLKPIDLAYQVEEQLLDFVTKALNTALEKQTT